MERNDKKIMELSAGLYRYCLSLTRSKQDAEDLMQDTLLKAHIRKAKLGEHVNLQALLLRMAKNSWIDSRRRAVLYRGILQQACRHPGETAAGTADETREQMAAAFQLLVRELSPAQRIVLLMRDVLGYSAMACARYLETTEGAVKSLLFRARRALVSARSEYMDQQAYSDEIETDGMIEAYMRGDIAQLLQLVQAASHQTHTVVRALASIHTAHLRSKDHVRAKRMQNTIKMQWAA